MRCPKGRLFLGKKLQIAPQGGQNGPLWEKGGWGDKKEPLLTSGLKSRVYLKETPPLAQSALIVIGIGETENPASASRRAVLFGVPYYCTIHMIQVQVRCLLALSLLLEKYRHSLRPRQMTIKYNIYLPTKGAESCRVSVSRLSTWVLGPLGPWAV